ncbi:hypothetical protein FHG87_016274 [Trinorchestia longiramus]|nr:hypothetical protein FHG87_016274 [Trinorchestia longiramus]
MHQLDSPYDYGGGKTDMSFEASISLWYCAPLLAAAFIGLASIAAAAAIGAIIAAAIAKHIFKYKYDKDEGGYGFDYGGGYGDDYGGYSSGGYHRREGGGSKHDDDYVTELTKRSFFDSQAPSFLKTFFRKKRSTKFYSHTKIKHIHKKLKSVKQAPVIGNQDRILEFIERSNKLKCGQRLMCDTAAVSGRPLSYLEQKIPQFVRAGDDKFDRLVEGETALTAALPRFHQAAVLVPVVRTAPLGALRKCKGAVGGYALNGGAYITV